VKRRDFIAGLGSAAAWPVVARAQQRPLPVVGFIASDTFEASTIILQALREGLAKVGYVDGRNVAIEYRFSGSGTDRLAAMVADLVMHQAAVIVAGSTSAALAAKSATATVPVVFGTAANPVEAGLVASLNRPGGNLTGFSSINAELLAKRLELLHECLPAVAVVAALVNTANPALAEAQLKDLMQAAPLLGVEIRILHASTEDDLEAAFLKFSQLQAGALAIAVDTFFNNRLRQLGALALSHRVPAIYQNREFATAGGLMSYGGNLANQFRLMGEYAGRILNGEKPADLPVQRSVKVDLIVNLKTANAFGIAIPETLLARADEVIE
jgi:putative tryptophan/tyrosine transport system substrate-binding protein